MVSSAGNLSPLPDGLQALLLEGWAAGFFNLLISMVEETCVPNPVSLLFWLDDYKVHNPSTLALK